MKDDQLKEKDDQLKEKDNELTELRRKMDVEIAQLKAAKESAEREAAKEAERADKAEARAEQLMNSVGSDVKVSFSNGGG